MAKELKCEIEKVYGFLNPEHTMVYVKVSWNDRKAKDEVRRCIEEDGELRLLKGLAITRDEIDQLAELADKADIDETGVNFDDIFRASEGIMEKREAGYQTQDGFIVVHRKAGSKS